MSPGREDVGMEEYLYTVAPKTITTVYKIIEVLVWSLMAVRLFEGNEHASLYQKYRLPPPEEVQNLIFSYLEKKKGKPFGLAVDVGCGTGQSTQILAPHFEKVVGLDISEAQIEKAKQDLYAANISYCLSSAEELPFEDCSVDLITASAAIHWFDIEKFLKEADRVLKPKGCMAFHCYNTNRTVHYRDCSESLTNVHSEMRNFLLNYANEKYEVVKTEYQEVLDTIPYPDKQRFLEIMGVSSNETNVELSIKHYGILACKPSQGRSSCAKPLIG
ncbi:putative methyltransferase DDB_G0268948 isoform X2 [Rhinatrema bivittatum]|uniref:putative methyltransferase DDB_G0268948 isoform X2 n=1 Tax=Rhinatrema bivittatum TaxID=194408 RepID=UPI0011280E38|nr:putative methyltransferase DDB_G0268948 isoform X2 [Rhinatrema bivittatum]